jgi:Uri superfamily endonuclease
VGALGRFAFPEGFLVYIGSALGSGGLAGRLKHHTRPTGPEDMRTRWHVDYLRRYTKIVEVWYVQDTIRREHEWAAVAGQLSGGSIPAKGFGASDCNCPAHLFHYSNLPRLRAFQHILENQPPVGDLMVVKA